MKKHYLRYFFVFVCLVSVFLVGCAMKGLLETRDEVSMANGVELSKVFNMRYGEKLARMDVRYLRFSDSSDRYGNDGSVDKVRIGAPRSWLHFDKYRLNVESDDFSRAVFIPPLGAQIEHIAIEGEAHAGSVFLYSVLQSIIDPFRDMLSASGNVVKMHSDFFDIDFKFESGRWVVFVPQSMVEKGNLSYEEVALLIVLLMDKFVAYLDVEYEKKLAREMRSQTWAGVSMSSGVKLY